MGSSFYGPDAWQVLVCKALTLDWFPVFKDLTLDWFPVFKGFYSGLGSSV